MDIPYEKEQLRQATLELIARNGMRSCYIRPLVYRGYGQMGLFPLEAPVDVAIAVWEWGCLPRRGGQAQRRAREGLVVAAHQRPTSLIPQAKACGQYLNSVLAKIESHKAGYEEGILLDDHGNVCEGTGENLFLVRDGDDPHPAADRLDPRRHQPPRGDPDRARPRLRGRRARHHPRRALPGRRDLHDRHRRRADADPRGRRPRGRHRPAGRDHARGAGPRSRTRCTGAPSATGPGSTRCRCARAGLTP